jgi:hypothetical protein
MINLAGVKNCDVTILQELKLAGIEAVDIGVRERCEVPSKYIGKCNNFIFSRAWYYWVVTGYMPLKYAQEMYNNFKDLNIRVAGHCGNPSPEEWCKPRDYSEKIEEYREKYWKKEITADEFHSKCNEIRKQGAQFIYVYHIDTQEGLNKFVEIIKKHNIIG